MKPANALLILVSIIFLFSCKDSGGNAPPENSSSVFAPEDGSTLFILGQASEQHMTDYLDNVKSDPLPAGFAFYTSLSDNSTLADMGRYKNFLDDYPNTTLQLAIWTGERQWGDPGYYLDDIVNGRYDSNIEVLATACKTINRPIYIRFGYEFDGWHNAYPPDKYISAYKYFVDKMREHEVNNVAYVWHSWGVGAYYGNEDFPDYYPPVSGYIGQELWYPGDDYVDWVAMSIFGTGWGNLNENLVVQYLIEFANDHNKPVMLAETAAIKTTEQSDGSWVIPNSNWFQNVFSLIGNNPSIKAFTYINVDWEGDNPSSTWGDTRIQVANPSVRTYWLNQIDPFIHGDDQLFEKIGFDQ